MYKTKLLYYTITKIEGSNMYTWEIEDLLKFRNYILYNDEYNKIMKTSPQIKHVKYNSYDNTFETWTKEDDNSKRYFKYKVRLRKK